MSAVMRAVRAGEIDDLAGTVRKYAIEHAEAGEEELSDDAERASNALAEYADLLRNSV